MITYEDFKKKFLELIAQEAEQIGWESVACKTTSLDKPTYTYKEVYDSAESETGPFGNDVRSYYKWCVENDKLDGWEKRVQINHNVYLEDDGKKED